MGEKERLGANTAECQHFAVGGEDHAQGRRKSRRMISGSIRSLLESVPTENAIGLMDLLSKGNPSGEKRAGRERGSGKCRIGKRGKAE